MWCVAICAIIIVVVVVVPIIIIIRVLVVATFVTIPTTLLRRRRALIWRIHALWRWSVPRGSRWARRRYHASTHGSIVRNRIRALGHRCHVRRGLYIGGHCSCSRGRTKALFGVVSIVVESAIWRGTTALVVTLGLVASSLGWPSLGVHRWPRTAIVIHGRTSRGGASCFWFPGVNFQTTHFCKNRLFLIEICLPVLAWERREWAVAESWLSWRPLGLYEWLTVHLTVVIRLACQNIDIGNCEQIRNNFCREGGGAYLMDLSWGEGTEGVHGRHLVVGVQGRHKDLPWRTWVGERHREPCSWAACPSVDRRVLAPGGRGLDVQVGHADRSRRRTDLHRLGHSRRRQDQRIRRSRSQPGTGRTVVVGCTVGDQGHPGTVAVEEAFGMPWVA